MGEYTLTSGAFRPAGNFNLQPVAVTFKDFHFRSRQQRTRGFFIAFRRINWLNINRVQRVTTVISTGAQLIELLTEAATHIR
ncbi:Uncharacterised protein [Shigella sonnei]|nr:Uncharacterised protein [Shigella sonnei]